MKERFFSVELKSKRDLRTITLSDESRENVLIEGTIGKLLHAVFADSVVLEIVGEKGVLRVNLTQDEIKSEKEVKSA